MGWEKGEKFCAKSFAPSQDRKVLLGREDVCFASNHYLDEIYLYL